MRIYIWGLVYYILAGLRQAQVKGTLGEVNVLIKIKDRNIFFQTGQREEYPDINAVISREVRF